MPLPILFLEIPLELFDTESKIQIKEKLKLEMEHRILYTY